MEGHSPGARLAPSDLMNLWTLNSYPKDEFLDQKEVGFLWKLKNLNKTQKTKGMKYNYRLKRSTKVHQEVDYISSPWGQNLWLDKGILTEKWFHNSLRYQNAGKSSK